MQELVDIKQLNISWRIHAVPERRHQRYERLDCLALEESIYMVNKFILVSVANLAGKSTLRPILGGKRVIPRVDKTLLW